MKEYRDPNVRIRFVPGVQGVRRTYVEIEHERAVLGGLYAKNIQRALALPPDGREFEEVELVLRRPELVDAAGEPGAPRDSLDNPADCVTCLCALKIPNDDFTDRRLVCNYGVEQGTARTARDLPRGTDRQGMSRPYWCPLTTEQTEASSGTLARCIAAVERVPLEAGDGEPFVLLGDQAEAVILAVLREVLSTVAPLAALGDLLADIE